MNSRTLCKIHLAPLLPFYDIDPEDVQFIGTSLWLNDETVREPALSGGVFAAVDKQAKDAFETRFESRFGDEPSRLSSLAYDAISVAGYISTGDPKTIRERTESPAGFFGVDGFVRFREDGTPDRGLAVYQIQNGRFVIVDPAPTQATGPG